MKIVNLSLFALLLTFSSQTAFAAHSCEQWQAKLPPKYRTDFRSASDPQPTASSVALSCGKVFGNAALSYAYAKGKNAIILQLTAKLGISAATTSLVMVTGYQVFAAYQAAQVIYSAFERDAACYVDHDFKRSIMEPVSHFYPEAVVNNWVRDLPCGQLSQMVFTKIQAVQRDVGERKFRQQQYDEYVKGRPQVIERAERLYPAESRTLTPAHLEYLRKKEIREQPTPLFEAANELLPCLKPEAVARMACGLVVELGWKYKKFTSKNGYGLEDELIESIIRVGGEKR